MEYRRPQNNDFEQMIELHNRNMLTVLSENEKADGFLSASFSVEQFKAMDEDLCAVVSIDAGTVCGYVFASSVEYNQNFPLVAAMIKQFPVIIYQGKSLDAYSKFIYGPVCIDKEYRGKDMLANLFNKMLECIAEKSPHLELLTVLISTENQRSINAHKKLGIEPISEFEFDNKKYLILILPINLMK